MSEGGQRLQRPGGSKDRWLPMALLEAEGCAFGTIAMPALAFSFVPLLCDLSKPSDYIHTSILQLQKVGDIVMMYTVTFLQIYVLG